MKRLLIILFLLKSGISGFCQSIVWQKTYGGFFFDYIYSIQPLGNGTYLAGGSTIKFGYAINGNQYPGACITKVLANGDTAWLKDLGVEGTVMSIAPTKDGNYYLGVQKKEAFGSSVNAVMLFKVDTAGNTLWQYEYPQYTTLPQLWKILTTRDGGCTLVGDYNLSSNLFAYHTDKFGTLMWYNQYNPGNGIVEGTNIEPLRNGNYLISGTAGPNVAGTEIDSAGNKIGSFFIYRSFNNVLTTGATIQQMPDKGYLVTANIRSSTPYYYVGRYDSLRNKLWGHAEQGNCITPFVNTDGSIIFYGGNTTWSMKRIALDSNTVWKTNFLNPPLFTCLASDGNDNGILGGNIYVNSWNQQDFHFAKVSNTGTPYIPGVSPLLTANKPWLYEKHTLSLFPNPTNTQIRFIGLQLNGTLQLYNMQGQVALSTTIQANESVDVSGLTKGVYVWRLGSGGKVFSGRLVKE